MGYIFISQRDIFPQNTFKGDLRLLGVLMSTSSSRCLKTALRDRIKAYFLLGT